MRGCLLKRMIIPKVVGHAKSVRSQGWSMRVFGPLVRKRSLAVKTAGVDSTARVVLMRLSIFLAVAPIQFTACQLPAGSSSNGGARRSITGSSRVLYVLKIN
jgi:hypothetical protein